MESVGIFNSTLVEAAEDAEEGWEASDRWAQVAPKEVGMALSPWAPRDVWVREVDHLLTQRCVALISSRPIM